MRLKLTLLILGLFAGCASESVSTVSVQSVYDPSKVVKPDVSDAGKSAGEVVATEPAKGCPACGPDCKCSTVPNNPDCKCPKCPKCGRCACQCECDHIAEVNKKVESPLWPDQPLTAADLDKMIAEAPDEKWRATFKKMRANWFNPDGTLKDDDAPETPFAESKAAPSTVRVDVILANFPCPPCKTWTDQSMPILRAGGWKESQLRVLTWGDPETEGMTKPAEFPACYRYVGDALSDFHIGLLDTYQIGDFYHKKPLGTTYAAEYTKAHGVAPAARGQATFQSCPNGGCR